MSNCNQQNIGYAVTYPCLRYLLLAPKSKYEYRDRANGSSSVSNHIGCFCPWSFPLNIGLNMLPSVPQTYPAGTGWTLDDFTNAIVLTRFNNNDIITIAEILHVLCQYQNISSIEITHFLAPKIIPDIHLYNWNSYIWQHTTILDFCTSLQVGILIQFILTSK